MSNLIATPLRNLDKYKVMLGSGSPRRRELLEQLGVPFTVAPPINVDETWPARMNPLDVPLSLALKKMQAYARVMSHDTLMITADTAVIVDNQVLGKPVDADDARRMLRLLSGKSHTVVTGVAVATTSHKRSFNSRTRVTFAKLSEEEIDYYVDNFRPLDKAGAYGIQEWIGAVAVSGIFGSYYNVVGLPIHRLYRILKSF